MAEGEDTKFMELDSSNNRDASCQLDSLNDASLQAFTEEQYQLVSAKLGLQNTPAQRSISQASADNLLLPSNVIPPLVEQFGEEKVLESLRQANRGDLVDIMRPNQVVSMQTASAVSVPIEEKKRYPSDMVYQKACYEFRINLEQKIGVEMPDGNDYRAFGEKVGIKPHTLSLLGETAMNRGTEVVKKWVQKNGKAATLGALRILLEDLNLIEPRDYLLEWVMDG